MAAIGHAPIQLTIALLADIIINKLMIDSILKILHYLSLNNKNNGKTMSLNPVSNKTQVIINHNNIQDQPELPNSVVQNVFNTCKEENKSCKSSAENSVEEIDYAYFNDKKIPYSDSALENFDLKGFLKSPYSLHPNKENMPLNLPEMKFELVQIDDLHGSDQALIELVENDHLETLERISQSLYNDDEMAQLLDTIIPSISSSEEEV